MISIAFMFRGFLLMGFLSSCTELWRCIVKYEPSSCLEWLWAAWTLFWKVPARLAKGSQGFDYPLSPCHWKVWIWETSFPCLRIDFWWFLRSATGFVVRVCLCSRDVWRDPKFYEGHWNQVSDCFWGVAKWVRYLYVSNDQPVGQPPGDQHDCRSSSGARTGRVRIVDLAGGPGCCGAGAYHFFDAWQKGAMKEMLNHGSWCDSIIMYIRNWVRLEQIPRCSGSCILRYNLIWYHIESI